MSNSKLVNYTKLVKNYTKMTNKVNKKITIHHMAGNLSVETCANVFNGAREASSNYGIGTDGRIGLYVEESNRAWTSSSSWNDSQAVTIEVANNTLAPTWTVSDKAMSSLINLCVDICQRNGIKSLNYTGDRNGNLTLHKMFKATNCPGPYLESKIPYIVSQVNARLGSNPVAQPTTQTAKSIDAIAREVIAGRWGNGSARKSALEKAGYNYNQVQARVTQILKGSTSTSASTSYIVRVTVSALNIREGAGVNYPVRGCIRDRGAYTIVQTSGNWGKLKSGAGWICLDYTKRI